MCGRAGRGSSASRAHLFFSSRRKKISPVVKEYCASKENCRRLFMLKALGSTEQVSSDHPCCDVCSRDSIPDRLHFEAFPTDAPVRKRTRRAIRKVDKDLEEKLRENLKAARQAYIQEHPSFQMLGPNFVCADSAIDKICQNAKFISSVEDLNFVTVRPEIKSKFLRVILSTLSVASTPRRHTLNHHY